MSTKRYTTIDDRLAQVRVLGKDNPSFLNLFNRESGSERICHVDEKCVIFFLKYDSFKVLKYVVDPDKNRKISLKLEEIVLRGLRNQFAVQGIEGVQVLESPVFYDGIPGLLGPFHYLPGFNLVCKNYSFSDSQHMDHSFIRDPDYILNLFRKQLDEGIIAKIHQKGIMHRDVKPGNIVYTNGNRRLNLIDWSISASFNEDFEDLSCGSFLGTRGYVTNNLNCSRDYFALGVSFAKVLCPELPIQNGLYVSNFEDDFRKVLRNKGQRFEDYFLDLISRPSEYDHNDFKLSQLEPSKDFLSVNCIADTTWVTSEYQTT